MDELRQIAAETRVYIVGSTGFCMENNYPAEIATMSEDQIADELVRSEEQRPGAFGKSGSRTIAVVAPQEHKVFRAVGKAHLRTNLPISLTTPTTLGRTFPGTRACCSSMFWIVGVNSQHVVMADMDSLDDPSAEIIKQVAKRGAFVGFDRVTSQKPSDDQRVTEILALLEGGTCR